MGSNRFDVKSQRQGVGKKALISLYLDNFFREENFHTPVLSVRDHPRKQSLSHQAIQ